MDAGGVTGGSRRVAGAVLAGFLVLTGCELTVEEPDVRAVRSDTAAVVPIEPDLVDSEGRPGEAEPSVEEPTTTTDDGSSRDPVAEEPVAEPPDSDVPVDDGSVADPAPDASIDPENTEIIDELVDAGFCIPDDFDDYGEVTAIHFVIDGAIQQPCFVAQLGDVDEVVLDDDPRLLAAWSELLRVTPLSLVDDISLVAGYEACSDCDTLAYVTTLDVDAEFFIIAVDVVAGEADPDELRLTMLHELAHVFTQRPGEQLIVQDLDEPCDTYHNGNGCFTDDSYVWNWIQSFWPSDEIATLPDDGSASSDEEGDARCAADPAFTGSYAAVHPEEDFAETFSAYVFDVEVDPALAEKFAFFDQYPEFVEVRDNARAEGLAGTEGNFDGCGF